MNKAVPEQRPAQINQPQNQAPAAGQDAPPFELAIIIVSWNTRELLAGCLQSVEAELDDSRISGQVWVVDNASTDGTVEMLRHDFPQAVSIACQENLGFAAANNAALAAIGFADAVSKPITASAAEQEAGKQLKTRLPDLVLLLNPDTKLHPGSLKTVAEFVQRTPAAGIVGVQLENGDGSFQHSAFAFPGLWQLAIELLPVPGRLVNSTLNGRYPQSLYMSGRAFEIGHPLGAAMGVRREAIQQVGFLDERFHMYVEEIDWSKRIKAQGWEAYCLPTAVITHYGGQSTGQIRIRSFVNLWTSRCYFYRKHYNRLKFWLAAQIVSIGMRRQASMAKSAAARGEFSDSELEEQLAAYAKVARIWRETEA